MKFKILIIFILISLSGYSQSDTPQVKKMFHRVDKGGYFGINVGATAIDSIITGNLGLRFMSVTDRWFSYGLILNGQFSGEISKDSGPVKYYGGNGGFQINPILFPRWTMHLSFPMTFGAGWIGEYSTYNEGISFTGGEFYYLYFEPGVELEFNMSHKIRMSFALLYTERFNVQGLSSEVPEILPLALQFHLKFGNFGFIDRY